MNSVTICSEGELFKAVEILKEHIASSNKNIVLLPGGMGAGKTMFVKHFIASISKLAQVSSPTFSIVNDYETDKGLIHHFDLYRLESVDEIEEIGFWEYIDSGNICFIEWPQIIAELLPPEQVITVDIAVSSPPCREFKFS